MRKWRNDLELRLQRLAECLDDGFRELVKAAGLDPARDFVGADLSCLDLSGVDLSDYDLRGCDLSGCDLRDARFDPTKLEGACFAGAVLVGARFGERVFSVHDLDPGDSFRDLPFAPEMVVIPPGTFMMGSPTRESGRSKNEGRQHEVRISQPFALGRFPVTFDEYDFFCAETGRKIPHLQGWGRGRRPAINTSHDDAKAYCEWLSGLTGHEYRLPSEAEWEYCCRAGSDDAYTFGDDPKQLGEYGWCSRNSGGQTKPVGSLKPNAFGLYDMHGNVWEWCRDDWHESYDIDGCPNDGSAWLTGDTSLAVLRGGSWNDYAGVCRSAFRVRGDRGLRINTIGFRLARTLRRQANPEPITPYSRRPFGWPHRPGDEFRNT